jgi:hypothetical protein
VVAKLNWSILPAWPGSAAARVFSRVESGPPGRREGLRVLVLYGLCDRLDRSTNRYWGIVMPARTHRICMSELLDCPLNRVEMRCGDRRATQDQRGRSARCLLLIQ